MYSATFFLNIEFSLNYRVLPTDKEKYSNLVEKAIYDLNLKKIIEHDYLIASANLKSLDTLVNTINFFKKFFDEEKIEAEVFIRYPISDDDDTTLERDTYLNIDRINEIMQALLKENDKTFIALGLLMIRNRKTLAVFETYPVIGALVTITRVDLF